MPRCNRCRRPSGSSTVLSTHHTSQGWTRYRRCACGALSIEQLVLGDDAAHSRRVATVL